MINFKRFPKEKRGTFEYVFWHWLAYNYTAWKLGVWKPKWLLHDVEKPFLKLILNDYEKVRRWHKHHNSHHIFYGRRNGLNKVDWLAAVLDWECGRYTKMKSTKTGRQQANYIVNEASKYTKEEKEAVKTNVFPILDYLGI